MDDRCSPSHARAIESAAKSGCERVTSMGCPNEIAVARVSFSMIWTSSPDGFFPASRSLTRLITNSSYANVQQSVVTLHGGAIATIVRLRRLSPVDGAPTVVVGNDRLDIIADRQYDDPTMFWHVADANSELEASRLVETPDRVIEVPRQ